MKIKNILSAILSAACLMSLTIPVSVSAEETADYDYIIGDANLDGQLNIRDAAHIAKEIAGRRQETISQSADYDLSGKVNIRDAAAIARAIAGRYIETRTHKHEWTDIYEEQPVYEEVTIYEERPIMEKRWLTRQKDENGNPIDIHAEYDKYVASGGTESYDYWYLNIFEWEPEWFGCIYQKYVVVGTEKIPVGTERQQIGTESIYSHSECDCGATTQRSPEERDPIDATEPTEPSEPNEPAQTTVTTTPASSDTTTAVSTTAAPSVSTETSTTEPTQSNIIIGDVNGDNEIKIFDAVAVAKYTVGKQVLTDDQVKADDVNYDGSVNIFDAVLIAKYTVGIPLPGLPK